MSRRAVELIAGAALSLGLASTLAGGAIWGAFSSTAAANGGDVITAAPDFVAPRATATVVARAGATATDLVSRGIVYYVYADVVDSGNPASGVASVTADVSALSPGQTAVALNAGSYSVGGVSYNRRSAALVAYKFLPEGTVSYSLTMTDAAGNSATEEGFSVHIDNTPIAAVDVQTENGSATAGRAQQGDRIVYTFSEEPDPGSILAGWDGSATDVVVRLDNGYEDTVRIFDENDAGELPLGTIELGRRDYTNRDRTFGASGEPSTMVLQGDEIVITLGTQSGNTRKARRNGTMRWGPSSSPTDQAGNAMSTTPATESGKADKEF